MGTFLLQEESRSGTKSFSNVFIVDGQQRLTTVVIFVATVLSRLTRLDMASVAFGKEIRLVRRRYLVDEDIAKFRTISEDTSFFESYVRIEKQERTSIDSFDTPSQRRLWQARQFFNQKLKDCSDEEVHRLLGVVERARILVYSVNDPGEATQIFELHNDRGKRLTDLEALKGFLTHNLYLSARNPEHPLEIIQGHFAKIYRTCETLIDLDRNLDEDSVLRYHCVAFINEWISSEYLTPKDLVKNKTRRLMQAASSDDEKRKVVEWILEFARQLQESFEVVLNLLKARDSMEEVADLYVLGRMATFYPLLMKTYSYSAQGGGQFRKVARLMEIFDFRGYGIANLRSDTGKSYLYGLARDFKGDFGILEADLREISGTARWSVAQRFHIGLGDPLFYNQSGDARYLLWKYENWLRSQPGNHYSKISWREYIGQGSKDKLSIEHIATPKGDLPDGDYALAEKEGNDDMFRQKLLHSLGNLILDCHSPNASKGKNPFPDKETHYATAPLISQNELREKFVKSVKPDGKPIWDEIAINARAERLINFAKEFWDPSKN